MLVLSRMVGETVQIGDAIAITVVRVTPSEVRLGIEAPPGTLVYRAELGADGVRLEAAEPDDPQAAP